MDGTTYIHLVIEMHMVGGIYSYWVLVLIYSYWVPTQEKLLKHWLATVIRKVTMFYFVILTYKVASYLWPQVL